MMRMRTFSRLQKKIVNCGSLLLLLLPFTAGQSAHGVHASCTRAARTSAFLSEAPSARFHHLQKSCSPNANYFAPNPLDTQRRRSPFAGRGTNSASRALQQNHGSADPQESHPSRRDVVRTSIQSLVIALGWASMNRQAALAATDRYSEPTMSQATSLPGEFLPGDDPPPVIAAAAAQEEMREFVDPQGMFSIRIPQRFYAIRRQVKGDSPNAKSGIGRRGSSIFSAGDMSKAEVVAIERFPTRLLLEENGIEATGSLKTFPDLGEPAVIASLINMRRENDKTGAGSSNTRLVPDSIRVSDDGKELVFQLRTQIEVQRPELLMEQMGVDKLFRITRAKASLRSSDGYLLAVFASALEQDYNGPDGRLLDEAVDSFVATEREFGF